DDRRFTAQSCIACIPGSDKLFQVPVRLRQFVVDPVCDDLFTSLVKSDQHRGMSIDEIEECFEFVETSGLPCGAWAELSSDRIGRKYFIPHAYPLTKNDFCHPVTGRLQPTFVDGVDHVIGCCYRVWRIGADCIRAACGHGHDDPAVFEDRSTTA